MNDDRKPDWDELWRQTQALDAQVKQLVKNEKRLYHTQRQIERQFQRINALNAFALEASFAFEPVSILGAAITMLFEVLPFDQAAAFMFDAEHARFDLVQTKSQHNTPREFVDDEAAHITLHPIPSAAAFGPLNTLLTDLPQSQEAFDLLAQLFPPLPDQPFALVLPLHNKQKQPLGLVVLWKRALDKLSYHENLPDSDDVPFLRLVTSHIQNALENATLHRQVEQLAEHLELRVEQRTLELAETNRELQESLKKLGSVHQQLVHAGKMVAVGTLVAGLSHELNNPISIILGFAQSLLENTQENDSRHLGLSVIERQAQRCTRLLRSLLDFSRRETQDKVTCSPQELLARVTELTQVYADNHGIELHTTFEGPLPDLEIGITDMETALVNLVKNAFDASTRGDTVTIHVSPASRRSRRGVEVSVHDNGDGIPPEVLPRIFEPFFTTKLVGHGTGLGLSLAHKAVELHGGSIQVQSQRSHGTTVLVWLPGKGEDV